MARQSQGRRTDYDWANVATTSLTRDLGTTTSEILMFTEASFAATVTRIRGKIGVYLDAATVADQALILFGIVVLNKDQIDGPEISTDAADEASWIWQGSIFVSAGAGVAAGSEEGQFGSIEIDTKAMRRLKINDHVTLMVHTPANLVSDGGGTYDVSAYMHTLFGS